MNDEITLSECIFTEVWLSIALLLPIYTRNAFTSGQGLPRGWCLSDRAIWQCYPYMPAIVILGVFRVARPCASRIRFHSRPSGGFCGSPFCEESGTQIGWCTGKDYFLSLLSFEENVFFSLSFGITFFEKICKHLRDTQFNKFGANQRKRSQLECETDGKRFFMLWGAFYSIVTQFYHGLQFK